MGSIKVDTSKVGKEVGFSVMAYTTLEYLRTHGSLTREVITDAIAKEYPDLGTDAMLVVFDALVDSRLIAFTPSKGTYRVSQSGRLAFTIAKAVVRAVAQGESGVEETDEELVH